VRIVGNKVKKQ